MRDGHAHMTGVSGSRRSGHGPDGPDRHRHPQAHARIGWLPDGTEQRQVEEEPLGVSDPVARLAENEEEPQIIPGPINSNNPLQTNVYHIHEPGYDPNRRHARRNPAQEYAHEVCQFGVI